ncbi:vWA domain-containing protein [Alteromonas halophila]|uniref:VWR domain protein in aerotolerance operon BatA n=1 Tax=Alteromonas halophila TaxID=516698 RepID=A0A918JCN2_9ALTE|nr:VWA domain-containing protein [Alteromonas halophila]GGW74508.1 VWR domain protein in aerotolerance operon BatA [Alteromonas halophila]
MFEFAWWYLLFALPLPLLVRLLPARQAQRGAALRVPGLNPTQQEPAPGIARQRGRAGLIWLIWLCLVVAAARPQWLGESVSIPNEAREMMLAVDLSGSMKIDDMQVNGRSVNRLTMTKHVLYDFIKRRVGDRLGLILFADTAYVQAPLTFDRDTVATLLDETVIGLVGERTAIGDAIGLAVKRFDEEEDSNNVLILLTDGQNTAGNITPEQAKELAVSKDVTIYTIGVGADQMVVNSLFGSRRINPSQELDEDMLTDIATATGGQYFRARDAQELDAIYTKLDELEPIEGESRKMRPLSALFYYPLSLALGLSVLLALLPMLAQLFRQVSSRRGMASGGQP